MTYLWPAATRKASPKKRQIAITSIYMAFDVVRKDFFALKSQIDFMVKETERLKKIWRPCFPKIQSVKAEASPTKAIKLLHERPQPRFLQTNIPPCYFRLPIPFNRWRASANTARFSGLSIFFHPLISSLLRPQPMQIRSSNLQTLMQGSLVSPISVLA